MNTHEIKTKPWEATDAHAEVAMAVWEGDDWRGNHEPDRAAILLDGMRETLTAAVGPAFDRAHFLTDEERETLREIGEAANKAVEDLGLSEDAEYLPDLLPLLVAVAAAAREHDAVCGTPGPDHSRTARSLRDALAALYA